MARLLVLLPLAATALLASQPVPVISGPARSAVIHTVTIEGARFEPRDLAVAVGDRITWVNKDPFPHTATSAAGGFDSGSIPPDASWTYTAARAGTFAYTCTLHPTMKGTVKVE